ncbi:dihydrofolate reductase family protein [Albidovulum sp.]
MEELPRAHVFVACSVDGFIARPGGEIDWVTGHRALEGEDFGYSAFLAGMEAVVMGRNTYEKALELDRWPYRLPVTVMSRSLDRERRPKARGAEVEITGETPREVLARLGARGMRDVQVDGGQVIQSFLRDGLVARMTLTRVPLLIGEGRPLFGPTGRDVPLRFVSARHWPNGYAQMVYEPV